MGTGGPCAIVTPTLSSIYFFVSLKGRSLQALTCKLLYVGIDLFSRYVAVQVSSAPHSLTSVFGMGTGGPCAIVTPTTEKAPLPSFAIICTYRFLIPRQWHTSLKDIYTNCGEGSTAIFRHYLMIMTSSTLCFNLAHMCWCTSGDSNPGPTD